LADSRWQIVDWSSDMHKVISKDGTPIAYDKTGRGPTVILISGALGTRMDDSELAQRLAPHFTAISVDRRGRGDSGDTAPYAAPYAVAREIEDIEAVIDAEGGTASLYGISSGGALVLEIAAALPKKVAKAVVYEPPFIVDDTHAPLPADYVPHLKQLIAEGRRGDAVEYFMTDAVGIPPEYVAGMRADPMWPGLEAVAHTLHYDGTIMGNNMAGKPLSPQTWASATMPILVATGGVSEPFMQNGNAALVEALPNAERTIIVGQDHNVASDALAPVLIEFFSK
jgi:pimeloyl-ACP methyl ester carboxylesterase